MTERILTEDSKPVYESVVKKYPDSDPEIIKLLVTEVEKYMDAIDALKDENGEKIIQGLLVGTGLPGYNACIWNIYSRDFTLKDTAGGALHEVSGVMYEMKKSLRGVYKVRLSNVNPSNLEDLKEDCIKQGMQTNVVLF